MRGNKGEEKASERGQRDEERGAEEAGTREGSMLKHSKRVHGDKTKGRDLYPFHKRIIMCIPPLLHSDD